MNPNNQLRRLGRLTVLMVVCLSLTCGSIAQAQGTATPSSPQVPAQQQPQTLPPKPRPEILDFSEAAKQIVFKSMNSSNPQYQAIEKAVQDSCKDVLKEIYRICGIAMPEGKRVEVVFQEIRAERNAVHYAMTDPTSFGSKIRFNTPLVARRNDENPRQIFQHEMVHALQQCWLGEGVFTRFPRWIHEGVATYVGGHGPARVNKFRHMGARLINGLDHVIPTPADYAEDYLAILYIEKTWGGEAIKKFVRDITIERRAWKASLKEVTGLSWAEFAEGAKQFALNYLEQLNNPNKLAQKSAPQQGTAQTPKPIAQPAASSASLQQTGTRSASAEPSQVPSATQTYSSLAKPQKPDLGLYVGEVDADTVKRMNLPSARGVLVLAVMEGGPAADAGLEADDVLVSFNGRPLGNVTEYNLLLDAAKPGADVVLQVLREGKLITVKLKVGICP